MRIVLPGDPYHQKRHRTSTFKKKDGTYGVRRYDPSANDKKSVRRQLLARRPGSPLNLPLRVDIIAFFRTPESWSDVKKDRHENTYRPKKPDKDNITKFYYDAMTGVIIEDDKLIVDGRTQKRYRQTPCLVLKITPISFGSEVAADTIKYLQSQGPKRPF